MNINKLKELYKDNSPQINIKNQSSIIIPIIKKDNDYYLLYEVRSYQLNSQPGDVCFPGGKIEKGESNINAAIRETCEELLISEKQIEIIASLNGELMSSGNVIWPYIAIIHNYEMTYNEEEVDHVFLLPINYLHSNLPTRYKIKTQTLPDKNFPYELIYNGKNYNWSSSLRDILFYRFEDEVIWGFTAKMTYNFIKIINNICD